MTDRSDERPELTRARAALLECTQRQKALLDKATAENRNFTPDEEQAYKKLETDVRDLEQQISEMPRTRGIRPEIGDRRSVRVDAQAGGMVWTDERGTEYRSYSVARGERLADAFRASPGDRPRVGLGRAIWDHVRQSLGYARADAPGEQRDTQVSIGASGGFVVPEGMGNVIPLAEPNSVVLRAGAEVVRMTDGTVKLGRILAYPQAYWYGTELATLQKADPTFGLFELQSKVIAVRTLASVQWFEDAQNGPQLLEQAVARSLGLGIDYAVLNGIAAQGWDGLRGWLTGNASASINEVSMGDNGAALEDYSPFTGAIQAVLEGDFAGELDQLTLVTSPRTWGATEQLVSSVDAQPLVAPASYQKLRKLVSTQLPVDEVQGSADNASPAFVGDFRQLLLGMRREITVEVTRQSSEAWEKLGVEIRAYARLDWVPMQPKHFARIVGIIPAT